MWEEYYDLYSDNRAKCSFKSQMSLSDYLDKCYLRPRDNQYRSWKHNRKFQDKNRTSNVRVIFESRYREQSDIYDYLNDCETVITISNNCSESTNQFCDDKLKQIAMENHENLINRYNFFTNKFNRKLNDFNSQLLEIEQSIEEIHNQLYEGYEHEIF